MWGEAPGTAPGGEGSNARVLGLTGGEELVTARVCRQERGNQEKGREKGSVATASRRPAARPLETHPWESREDREGELSAQRREDDDSITPGQRTFCFSQ